MFLRSINRIICVVIISLFLSGHSSKVEDYAPTCQDMRDEITRIERAIAQNNLRRDVIKTNRFFFDVLDPYGKYADYYGFGMYMREQKILRVNRALQMRKSRLVHMYKKKGCNRK